MLEDLGPKYVGMKAFVSVALGFLVSETRLQLKLYRSQPCYDLHPEEIVSICLPGILSSPWVPLLLFSI